MCESFFHKVLLMCRGHQVKFNRQLNTGFHFLKMDSFSNIQILKTDKRRRKKTEVGVRNTPVHYTAFAVTRGPKEKLPCGKKTEK